MRFSGTSLTRILVLLVSFGGAACSGATKPSETLRSLSISPERSSLHVGEKVQFRAVGTFGDGHTEDVSATWVASGDQIRLNAPGDVSAIKTGLVTLSATERLISSLPIEVVEDLRGTWSGECRTETCNRVSGSGPAYCARSDGQIKQTEFTVVEQAGRRLALSMTIERTIGSFVADIASGGTFRPQQIPLLVNPPEFSPATRRLLDWEMALARVGASWQLTGSFVMEYEHTNAFGSNLYRDNYLVTLTKQ